MTQEYLTVTTLTKYLKRKFEADPYLERVYLTGEISNFRMRANAHQYFSLKMIMQKSLRSCSKVLSKSYVFNQRGNESVGDRSDLPLRSRRFLSNLRGTYGA